MSNDKVQAEFNNAKMNRFLNKTIKQFKGIESKEKKYLDLLSMYVIKDVTDHFEKQDGPTAKWRKWSQAYQKKMAKAGKGSNLILQDNGRLKNSFVPGNYRTSKEGVLWFNPAKTNKGFPYAFAHNEGGDTLPKRRFMWLSSKALGDMGEATLKFLLDEK